MIFKVGPKTKTAQVWDKLILHLFVNKLDKEFGTDEETFGEMLKNPRGEELRQEAITEAQDIINAAFQKANDKFQEVWEKEILYGTGDLDKKPLGSITAFLKGQAPWPR